MHGGRSFFGEFAIASTDHVIVRQRDCGPALRTTVRPRLLDRGKPSDDQHILFRRAVVSPIDFDGDAVRAICRDERDRPRGRTIASAGCRGRQARRGGTCCGNRHPGAHYADSPISPTAIHRDDVTHVVLPICWSRTNAAGRGSDIALRALRDHRTAARVHATSVPFALGVPCNSEAMRLAARQASVTFVSVGFTAVDVGMTPFPPT